MTPGLLFKLVRLAAAAEIATALPCFLVGPSAWMTQKLLNLTERTHVSAEMLHKVAFAFSRAALLMIVGRGLREIRTTCLPVALLAHPARSLADVKGVPRSSVGSPLDESDLDDELRLNPLAVPASRH